jgi:hypothetical protein
MMTGRDRARRLRPFPYVQYLRSACRVSSFRHGPFRSCRCRSCSFPLCTFPLRFGCPFRRRPFRGQLPGPCQEPCSQVLTGLGHGGAAELLEVLALALLPGTAFGTRCHVAVAAGGPFPGNPGPAPEPAAWGSQKTSQQTH